MQIQQIATVGGTLYALGNDGSIWVMENAYLSTSKWRPMELPPDTLMPDWGRKEERLKRLAELEGLNV